jgi:methionyl-tRNA formyltransferase
LRIVFFGTPEFAVPTLDAVARAHEVVLVVAQPDKPAGRGMHVQPPAIAVRARELGLQLVQPAKIRTPEFLDSVAAVHPDAGVVIAYGKILPAALLEIPKHGFINVHASVLPKYRGAAPIQRAIEAGETTTGVTIMRVDEELDHGPVLSVATLEIGRDERTSSLAKRLSELGAGAIVSVLRDIERGTAVESPQDHAQATFAPKIAKQEGAIRWNDSAAAIYNRFRAFDPWPGVFFDWHGETIKVTNIATADLETSRPRVLESGMILSLDSNGVTIATADGVLRFLELQRAGKARAAAADVARGLGWRAGARLQ